MSHGARFLLSKQFKGVSFFDILKTLLRQSSILRLPEPHLHFLTGLVLPRPAPARHGLKPAGENWACSRSHLA